jgi:hypothetical protein
MTARNVTSRSVKARMMVGQARAKLLVGLSIALHTFSGEVFAETPADAETQATVAQATEAAPSARPEPSPAVPLTAAPVESAEDPKREFPEPPRQPRDYFLNAPKGGMFATFDAYTIGLNATLERRITIEKDDYASIIPRVNALASLGFGELGAHMDARYLFFGFGASATVRSMWRTYTFEPGIVGTRDLRREIDAGKEKYKNTVYATGELRARMALPIHENLLFVTNVAARYETAPGNTFDWLHTTMHDGGLFFRYDATLFLRANWFGGVGPTLRGMELRRNGRYETELAFGGTFGRRIGFFKQNDLLILQVLARPKDESFGFQILRLPLYTMLLYRVGFEL